MLLSVVFVAVVCVEISAFAGQNISLVWDPSPSTNVAGYNIYYGTSSGNYPVKFPVGNATNTTIPDLIDGTTYYFVATAYTTDGLESDFSNELPYSTPAPVNKPPTLDALGNLKLNEDAGIQSVNLTGITSGAVDENQTLTITASSSNPALIPNPTINYISPNSTGTLKFASVADASGSADITVTVNDGSATNNTVSRVFTVTVNAVNDLPTLNSIGNVTLNENDGQQIVNLSGITSGAANENQTLMVSATSSNPSLIPNPTLTYTSPNTVGSLTFTPVANASGTATITVAVNDGGSSNNLITRTFTVTVNALVIPNQPPTLDALNTLTLDEDAGAQTVSLSGITSGSANENQTLAVTAASSNPALIPNPTVNYTSPGTTGTLTFTPVANGNGTAAIAVTVNDGGASNNITTRTFTVFVLAVNDAPTLDPIANLNLNANSSQQTVNLSGVTSGAANENQTLTVSAYSSNPSIVPNPTVNYTSPNATGTLTFTPVANASGTATITVIVNDGASANNTVTRTFTVTVHAVNQMPTLNALNDLSINENSGQQTVNLSGITSGATNENQTLTISAASSRPGLVPNPTVNYTSPNSTGTLLFTPVANTSGSAVITVTVNDGGASNNIISKAFTVTVNAVNAAPTLNALSNLTLAENSGQQTVNLSGITSGATNEVQPLTVTATSSNPALIPNPTVNYTSANTTGSLTLTPVANTNGSAIITVTVNDGQSFNNVATRTFLVTVNAASEPPTLDAINNVILGKSAGQQQVNLSGISSGSGSEQALTITAESSDPALIPNLTISYTSPDSTGTLMFAPATVAPAPVFTGRHGNIVVATAPATPSQVLITVTVNNGQPTNNLVKRTFTVTVNADNVPPTLNALNDLQINENAGQQTVNLSGITSGASDETQTLSVAATSSNPSLIPNPTVNYTSANTTGTLTFTPAANAFGTATITVTVNDGQATDNTFTRTFTVTVNPVNQPPTLNTLNNLTLIKNVGQQTVNLSGITSGAANENQTLTISASSSNPNVIPTPLVNYLSPNATGTITFTPVANATGNSTVTVTVNDGQGSNNIVSRTFTVTVNASAPTNQPPTISALTNQTMFANASLGPVSFTIADAETSASNLTLSVVSSAPSLIPESGVIFGGSGSNRTLTLLPALGQNGNATITIYVSDGSASASSSFLLTVQPAALKVATITLVANGDGAISPDLNNQVLIVGQPCIITATPGLGKVFGGWTGSITSSSSELNFIVTSNLTLQANFISPPFAPTSGTYNGLFYEDSEVNQNSSGNFTISVTTKGTYSGKLQIGSQSYSFSGKTSTQGSVTNSIARKNTTPLKVELWTGSGEQADQLFGHVSDGKWTATLSGDRAVFNSKTAPAPFAANYTMIIPPPSDGSAAMGYGYGTVKVDGNGVATFAGTLADGTKVTQSATISADGLWPFYIPLYSGSGSMISWLAFTNQETSDFSGSLNWICPSNPKAKYYPAGFTNQCVAFGQKFAMPGTKTIPLNFGNVSFGNSGEMNASSISLKMTLSPLNGVITASAKDPTSGKTVSFGGVLMQKLNMVYGFVLNTGNSLPIIASP